MASRTRLVQLLPDQPGGVRDFAQLLMHHWAQAGRTSVSVSLDPTATRAPLEQQLRRLCDGEQHPEERVALLLHYSGYGYQRRGLPYWLADQLQDARRSLGPQLRLVTLFHELHASGPPWRSAFWLGGLQARLGHHIARMSDALWTNSALHARRLEPATRGRGMRVVVRPVFSNVGEPDQVLDVASREPLLIVFGSRDTRLRAMCNLRRLEFLLQDLGVRRLIEVGSGSSAVPSGTAIASTFLGRLEPAQLGTWLQRCRYALIDYPSIHLGKSGVFAAYATHGCVVINTSQEHADADGLMSGRHYLSVTGRVVEAMTSLQAASMADQLCRWYAEHPSRRQADELADLLDPGIGG